jgi:pimeloyl-ACP methyl ester carboxylesterase
LLLKNPEITGRFPTAPDWHALRESIWVMKPKIVFIHGMFLNAASWELWIAYFQNLGFSCDAPSWPLHQQEPSQLRNHIPGGLGSLSLNDVLSHYRGLLRTERFPPVLIGHSIGGLLVQILIHEGLAIAGVAICPVAPNHMLALDWGLLGKHPLGTNHFVTSMPLEMAPDDFHEVFANTLSEYQNREAYERYVVPESLRILRDSPGEGGNVDVKAPHVPLLFVGAEYDVIIPPSLVMRNAAAYTDERSHTEYAEFSGRSHFICGEPRWEEVAERVAKWLEANLTFARSAGRRDFAG